MSKALFLIKSKLPFFILGMMLFGISLGSFNDLSFLKILVTPTLFLMIYPMMINLKITDLFKGLAKPKTIILSITINFIASPLLAFLLGKLFFSNYPMLMVGLMLISVIPTSGMTASWTGLAKGDMKSAILIMSANLLLSIILIPFYMNIFLGKVISINTMAIILNLLKVVVIPLILGDITRRIILSKIGNDGFKAIKPNLSAISSIGVLLIVFIAMALKSKTIINQGGLVLYSIIPLTIYYGGLLILSIFIGRKSLNRENKIALVYGTTMRNLTIALALSLSGFGQSLAVFIIALGYIIQVPLAAFYMQVLNNQNYNYNYSYH
ncbi:arsenic resistance protein [Sporosalibacterium faouarense]|uniref:arsenic resistance protein n=1 Tax=Sporosalibacterium faouarense TaxID=516123 RepID=UPI00141C80E5|nr:arsenic resistance protein [Sporosalibacterium faouarense]MTI46509.1 arsenic resistance protein [Bacillota bacterium]